MSSWQPSLIPTSTLLTSINPTHTLGLMATYTSAAAKLSTETGRNQLITLSRQFRGAQASLAVISGEQLTATATDDQVKAHATQLIFNNTLNLKSLEWEENLYDTNLNDGGNIFYMVIFAIVFVYTTAMIIKSRFHWYNITYFCGYGLEFAGFLGRVLSLDDNRNKDYFLLQYVTLTISPAFIMAGIYFLFAQLVVIHGRQFSVLKPMWYSYFFITTDVLSLIVQAIGGGMASLALSNNEDATPGTNTMTAGIVFQVAAMSVFVLFWIEFLNRLYFRHEPNDSVYSKRSFGNFFKLLFNTPGAQRYKWETLEENYNPRYAHIRKRKLIGYMPLAISVSVIVIYIRCVYRVVELIQGFDGYLIVHEVFLMVLDAAMIAIAGLIAIPFHPVIVFGKDNVIKAAHIKRNHDEKTDSQSLQSTQSNQSTPSNQSISKQ